MAQNRTIRTIFQRTELSEPALFSPSDTTKPVDGFPKLCVSTFSEAMIQAFASLEGTRQIAELYTANGVLPVYRLRYRGTDIAFYLSRVGAPACVSGFEEVVAMGAETFVLFGSCGVLDDEAVKGRIIIPVSAVRDEGTSYHYAPPSPEIEMDPRSVQVLERVLSAENFQGYRLVDNGHTGGVEVFQRGFRRTVPAGSGRLFRVSAASAAGKGCHGQKHGCQRTEQLQRFFHSGSSYIVNFKVSL